MNYRDESIKSILCYDGTSYIKGPFDVDGEMYDYKIVDESGEDYCDVVQMNAWNLEIKKTFRV